MKGAHDGAPLLNAGRHHLDSICCFGYLDNFCDWGLLQMTHNGLDSENEAKTCIRHHLAGTT